MSLYKSIDKLRIKVDKNQPITLNEACFVLWADLHVCSTIYLQFKTWCIKTKLEKNKQWSDWKAFFLAYKKMNATNPNGWGYE